jgi:hypothetical protein
VRRARPVALFTAHVPFCNSFALDVVVHRVATIAKWTGRALHIVAGVVGGPPICSRSDLIGSPNLVGHVPLCAKRIIVIAFFREIALLPLAAVHKRDVVFGEFHQRVRLGEVRDDELRMHFGVDNDIRHAGLAPARIDLRMTGLACGVPRIVAGWGRLGQSPHREKREGDQNSFHIHRKGQP